MNKLRVICGGLRLGLCFCGSSVLVFGLVAMLLTSESNAQVTGRGGVPLSKWETATRSGGSRSDFRDSSGRSTGSAVRTGDRVTFRDSSGRVTGTASVRGGDITFRDASGRTVGTSQQLGNGGGSTLRESSGRTLGSSRETGGSLRYRDSSGRSVGSGQATGSGFQFRDSSGRSSGSMTITRGSSGRGTAMDRGMRSGISSQRK
jgi:hypothetical protein